MTAATTAMTATTATTATTAATAATATTAARPASALGAVHGAPAVVLRLEAALVLVAAIATYRHLGGGWRTFALWFLVPDLSMLGYLIGRRAGAIAYDTAHSYLLPGALTALALAIGSHALGLLAAIGVAHIGLDRLLGYGLKYATAFGDTHLGRLGRGGRRRG